jgi:N-formylglutamate amidohydrolase
MMNSYPDWVVLHIPHDSKVIPENILDQFVLNDKELEHELIVMTDYETKNLYLWRTKHSRIIYSPVSRLVVDIERFLDDEYELMAECGMGAIYKKTHDGKRLRRKLVNKEKISLLENYYHSHHAKLTNEVSSVLGIYDHCVILDLHSFSSKALPYEQKQDALRPDICLGFDSFHTPKQLVDCLLKSFLAEGMTQIAINTPFSGSIVPLDYYNQNDKVKSIMIEVKRSLYMDEESGEILDSFPTMARKITRACQVALKNYLLFL